MGIQVSAPHRSGLSAGRFAFAGVSISTTSYTEVARFTIATGTAWAPGYGTLQGQDSATGRIYMDMRDNSASPGVEENGSVRLELHDAQDVLVRILWQGRTEELRTSLTDRRQQIPFPAIGEVGTQNMALVWTMKADSAFTPGASNVVLFQDMTEFSATL